MSYILDALRKSEHERQLAAGSHAGIMYPIEIQQSTKPWLLPSLLTLAVVIAGLAAWWEWPQANKIEPPSTSVIKVESPQTFQESSVVVQKIITPTPTPEKVTVERPQKNRAVITQPSVPSEPAAPLDVPKPSNNIASVDPLKDLPALSITGYIHNEQGESLAMINNQLVREGEEVAPDLQLVKILQDSAVFSYKGYVFSR